MSSPNRIYFVDFARSFAIVLALTDHSMNDFGMLPANTPALKVLTSSATPTFLLLFGMMLEMVYLKRIKRDGLRKVAAGLINRSFQCYIGYLLTVVAGVIGGLQMSKSAFAASLFLGNCHFGNILKLYTVMLIVAIPLLWYRQKYGIIATIILCLSPWIIYPLFAAIPPFHKNLEIFTSYMLGFGGQGGPSVLHSLTLVAVGMLSASFISIHHKYNFQIKTSFVLVIFLALVSIIIYTMPNDTLLYNHLRNIYRDHNHPIYYVFSCTLGLSVALISSFIIPIGNNINQTTSVFLAFGRSSLTAFTAGNIILNLIATRIAPYDWTFVAPMLFVLTVFLILQFYERIYPRLSVVKNSTNFFRGVTVRYHWFYVRRFSNLCLNVLR